MDKSIQQQVRASEQRPPPYSSGLGPIPPLSSSTPRVACTSTPGLPSLDYAKYVIPDCTVSKDAVEVVTENVAFNADPTALAAFIRDQASLPPLPYVRITGTSPGTNGYGQHIDFEVKLNMLCYFIDNDGKGWNYIQLGGREQSSSPSRERARPTSLEEWTKKYCREKSALKSFTLTRKITNWNTSFLEGQIRSLVATAGYTGQVAVSFPVQYARVTVQPPRSGIAGLLTTMFSPLMDKKQYEIVTGVWPYASLPPGTESGRACVVQSEDGWWEEWKEVVRMSIAAGRRGIVSVDDLLMLKMHPTTR